MNRRIVWIDVTPGDEDNLEELREHEEDDENEQKMLLPQHIRKIAVGPFGAFEVVDFASPYSDHIIYTGHTNFLLTKEIVDSIDKCEGVDILRVPSKYTFHLGIGLGFEVEDVLFNIEMTLNANADDFLEDDNKENQEIEEVTSMITDIVKDLKEHKYWAIYILPNGNYETAFCDKEEDLPEFNKKVEKFKEFKKVSNGVFLVNDKDNEQAV